MSHSSKLWSLANYQGSCRKPRLRVSHSEVQVAHWHWSGTEPLNWWDLMPIQGRWCQSRTELLDTRLESGGLESWLRVLVSTTQLNDTNTQRQRPDFYVAIGKYFCLAPETQFWKYEARIKSEMCLLWDLLNCDICQLLHFLFLFSSF